MKKIFTLFFFLFVYSGIYSQSNEPYKPRDVKNSPEVKNAKQTMALAAQNAKAASMETTVSQYFGLDEKIKPLMIDNNIGTEFPKALGVYNDKKEYLIVVNEWIRKNPSFIKPELQNTVVTDK